MNLFKKIYSGLENKFLSNADERRIMVEAFSRGGVKKDSALYQKLTLEAKNLQSQTLKKWKQAVSGASDPDYPSWQALSELYQNLLLDNHLASVIDTRILFVQRSAFKLVDDKDKENPELSWLLERPWHEEMMYKVLFSRYQGRTLIEMYNLTPSGEIAEIEEIPQPYFNAKTGLITQEADGTTGWDYRSEMFSKHYLQVGKNHDLGMLEKLAPIVLAKKLALGSYQDYIEKFGVPPIFITTDREDDNRLQQLFTAAQNFKSNHFMVGRGKEKFEIGIPGNTGVAPFDALIDRTNDEISKRILGGSGLTDEKAFVGSADIQYRLLKDRYESDKLFYKYIFNEHIKPRLISISPIYKPLEKHYFEWDNTETLDIKSIIDAVQKLGNIYEIDPEYVTKITGIPILKKKESVSNPEKPTPAGGEDTKKK